VGTASVSPPRRVLRERAGALDRELWILLALTVAGAALRFATLGQQGYWYDEAVTVDLVRHPLGTMLREIPHTESTPPLYYLVAWAWSRVVGTGEFGLRALSALAGALTVPLVYDAGARLAPRRAGLIAAALVAFNPLLVWYGQEARAYALVTLLAAGSFALFARALRAREPGWRLLASWAAVSGLALATHYFAAFLVGAVAIALLVAARRRRRRRRDLARIGAAAAGVVAVGLALLPLVLEQAGNERTAWIGHIPVAKRIVEVGEQALIGPIASARIAGVIATGVLALVVGWFAWRRAPGRRRTFLLCVALGLAPILLPALLDLVELDVLISRNALVGLIPLAVAAGIALGGRAAGRAGIGVAAAACIVGLAATVAVWVTPSLQRTDWRQAARLVGTSRTARVIVAPGGYQAVPLDLYLPHVRRLRMPARTSKIVELGYAPHALDRCWWGAPCGLSPRVLTTAPPLPGFRLVSRRSAGPFTAFTFVGGHHRVASAKTLGIGPHTRPSVLVYVQRVPHR
jgi:mannosyltransferase